MNTRILSLLTVVFVFVATAAEPVTNLTLERAIEMAIKNNPRLAEAEAELDAAKAPAQAAGRLPNPEAIARMESAPHSSGTTSQAEYLVGVSQAIPLGGRLSAARKAEPAVAGARAQELNLARFELTRTVRISTREQECRDTITTEEKVERRGAGLTHSLFRV
jgi:outer membrane protein, heavy metal efflux system